MIGRKGTGNEVVGRYRKTIDEIKDLLGDRLRQVRANMIPDFMFQYFVFVTGPGTGCITGTLPGTYYLVPGWYMQKFKPRECNLLRPYR
jgi:hypothetical protein